MYFWQYVVKKISQRNDYACVEYSNINTIICSLKYVNDPQQYAKINLQESCNKLFIVIYGYRYCTLYVSSPLTFYLQYIDIAHAVPNP